jgi:exopolyphosphatase/guanosine-5'-triphosphate,3'-diphosphate pyrophosphatase
VVIRHVGPEGGDSVASIRSLSPTRFFVRARLLGATMRVAYLLSASMPGVLPRTSLRLRKGVLVLSVPGDFADLASDRVLNRLKTLGRLVGANAQIEIAV